jgi:hypothetical protein
VTQDPAIADLADLAKRLAHVQESATQLPWAHERPWRVDTHLWTEDGVPTIDLHDLGTSLARKTVDEVAEAGDALATGAVRFITGRGRHSIGRAVLPDVVASALEHHASEHGWQVRGGRPGTIVLVTDPARAPNIATGGLGPGFYLIAIAMAAAATWACPPAGIIAVVVAIVCWIAFRAK